jgi:hypothetical protein
MAAASTINYELAMLRRSFRLAVRAGKVGMRPEFSMLHVDNARKGFFEAREYAAVQNLLPNYLKPVAQIAYITGWRPKSELLTRQWRPSTSTPAGCVLNPAKARRPRAGCSR